MEIQIANSIRTMRKKLGISQEVLAEAMNVSVQAVSKWELGQSIPDAMMLPQIANYFGITLDELYYGIEEEDPAPAAPENAEDPELTEEWDESHPDPEPIEDWDKTHPDPDTDADNGGDSAISELVDSVMKSVSDSLQGLHGLGGLGPKIQEIVEKALNNVKNRNVKIKMRYSPDSPDEDEDEDENDEAIILETDGDCHFGDIPSGSRLIIHGNLVCGEIAQDAQVIVDGMLKCGEIYGKAEAQEITCSDVYGIVKSRDQLTCGDIYGTAKGMTVKSCDIYGMTTVQGVLTCSDVYGRVYAGVLSCGDVYGYATSQGDVTCGDVYGFAEGRQVRCGDIYGCVNGEILRG